ncbi:MAG: hypothetical protein A2Y56_12565 [Candidatus Aminicenantes bacterium RBG_13_63_10]|nr:MAG: hypothetical protein A2Y56_12565 [Candidatus Aminicenantes bacterium RBG_13_63_10]
MIGLVLCAVPGRGQSEEFHFATDVNGVTCGHTRVVLSPIRLDGRDLLELKHESLTLMTVLGRLVESRLTLTYHIDSSTGRFIYHDSLIVHGAARLASSIRIEGDKALIESEGGRLSVALPAGAILANTLFFPDLLEDFVRKGLKEKTYLIFDGRDGAVQETVFSRAGEETLRLAGRDVETVVLDSFNRRTGQRARLWLETRRGIAVQKTALGGGLIYLADASVGDRIRSVNMDHAFLTASDRAVSNPKAISYLKARLELEPTGLRVSPESLNVPGQRFNGTVADNRVDGVFEVSHTRYDGASAPPFPPDFSGRADLAEFLAADDMTQSDDPLLAAAARDIAKDAGDTWEAVKLLGRWVAENIKGAIPGGITARGTYDQRAGDCGGHSFLMAAFCRSLGIPARVVWGCVHTGKSFGQHGWNEVYMGEVGWIPLDTTMGEIEVVDSGHVRIGHYQSLSTQLNLRRNEIIDVRTDPEQR